MCVMSWPSNRIRPSVGSSSRMSSRPVVDFPQPVSPTRPIVSPLRIEKLTPSTAFTAPTFFWKMMPRVTGKCFCRSVTSRSVSPVLSATAPAAVAWFDVTVHSRCPPSPVGRRNGRRVPLAGWPVAGGHCAGYRPEIQTTPPSVRPSDRREDLLGPDALALLVGQVAGHDVVGRRLHQLGHLAATPAVARLVGAARVERA